MAPVTICSDFGAQKIKLVHNPMYIFPRLTSMLGIVSYGVLLPPSTSSNSHHILPYAQGHHSGPGSIIPKNNATCRNMDGPRDCHTEWSKSDRERQVSYNIAYVWNLKNWYKWSYLQNGNRVTDVKKQSYELC